MNRSLISLAQLATRRAAVSTLCRSFTTIASPSGSTESFGWRAVPRNLIKEKPAPTPVRVEKIVPWKVNRLITGHLPVTLVTPDTTRKPYVEIRRVDGDVISFAREVQLFMGPMYVVTTNDVFTAVYIESTPQVRCTEQTIKDIKKWLASLGA